MTNTIRQNHLQWYRALALCGRSLAVVSGCWKSCIWNMGVLRLSRAFAPAALDLVWRWKHHHSPPCTLSSDGAWTRHSTLGGVLLISLWRTSKALLVKALSLAVRNSSLPSPALEKSTDDCTHSLLLNKDFGNYLSYAKHFGYHFWFYCLSS